MRLEDCNLNVTQAVGAPFTRTSPEPSWVHAHQSGVLPAAAFELYELARYVSFGSAPPFLADVDNVLFSYFGIILESVRDSLVEANEHRVSFEEASSRTYDLGKKVRGEPWDPDAPVRARREFRYFLLSELAALDAVADLTAILLTGAVPNLRVGRAQFSRIDSWLHQAQAAGSAVLSPREHFARELYGTLRPLVHPPDPERDWLSLIRLYRNKGAHLGSSVFRQIGLHDDSAHFYTFLPREWPYIWERHMKPAGQHSGPSVADLFRQTLIHQDLITYVRGVQRKVNAVAGASLGQLVLAYRHLQHLPFNQEALAELDASSERYAFDHFLE